MVTVNLSQSLNSTWLADLSFQGLATNPGQQPRRVERLTSLHGGKRVEWVFGRVLPITPRHASNLHPTSCLQPSPHVMPPTFTPRHAPNLHPTSCLQPSPHVMPPTFTPRHASNLHPQPGSSFFDRLSASRLDSRVFVHRS